MGISEAQNSSQGELSVWTNEKDGMLNIIFGKNISAEGCRMKVMDIAGKTLQSVLIPAGKNNFTLAVKNYSKGIYIVDAVTSKSKKHFSVKAAVN